MISASAKGRETEIGIREHFTVKRHFLMSGTDGVSATSFIAGSGSMQAAEAGHISCE